MGVGNMHAEAEAREKRAAAYVNLKRGLCDTLKLDCQFDVMGPGDDRGVDDSVIQTAVKLLKGLSKTREPDTPPPARSGPDMLRQFRECSPFGVEEGYLYVQDSDVRFIRQRDTEALDRGDGVPEFFELHLKSGETLHVLGNPHSVWGIA